MSDDGSVFHVLAAATKLPLQGMHGHQVFCDELLEREASVYHPNEDTDEHHCRPQYGESARYAGAVPCEDTGTPERTTETVFSP